MGNFPRHLSGLSCVLFFVVSEYDGSYSCWPLPLANETWHESFVGNIYYASLQSFYRFKKNFEWTTEWSVTDNRVIGWKNLNSWAQRRYLCVYFVEEIGIKIITMNVFYNISLLKEGIYLSFSTSPKLLTDSWENVKKVRDSILLNSQFSSNILLITSISYKLFIHTVCPRLIFLYYETRLFMNSEKITSDFLMKLSLNSLFNQRRPCFEYSFQHAPCHIPRYKCLLIHAHKSQG